MPWSTQKKPRLDGHSTSIPITPANRPSLNHFYLNECLSFNSAIPPMFARSGRRFFRSANTDDYAPEQADVIAHDLFNFLRKRVGLHDSIDSAQPPPRCRCERGDRSSVRGTSRTAFTPSICIGACSIWARISGSMPSIRRVQMEVAASLTMKRIAMAMPIPTIGSTMGKPSAGANHAD